MGEWDTYRAIGRDWTMVKDIVRILGDISARHVQRLIRFRYIEREMFVCPLTGKPVQWVRRIR